MRCSSSTTRTFTGRLVRAGPVGGRPRSLHEGEDEHRARRRRRSPRRRRTSAAARPRRRPPRRPAGRRAGARDTTIGGTAGIIELRRGYYDRLKHKEKAMKKVSVLGSAAVAGAALAWHGRLRELGATRRPRPWRRSSLEERLEGHGQGPVHGAARGRREGRGLDRERDARDARPAHPREGRLLGARTRTSAGGHFNAAGNPHAAPDGQGPAQRRPRQHRGRRRRQGPPRDHVRPADRQAGPRTPSSASPSSSTRRPTT